MPLINYACSTLVTHLSHSKKHQTNYCTLLTLLYQNRLTKNWIVVLLCILKRLAHTEMPNSFASGVSSSPFVHGPVKQQKKSSGDYDLQTGKKVLIFCLNDTKRKSARVEPV